MRWSTLLAELVATAPASDEIEVSLFGPGRGEAVVVHLGGNEWLTVDSCIDQSTGRSPALDYLEGLGVALDRAVRIVVGTHAHDDHMAGIGRVFEAASDAQFVTSAAFTSPEFYAALEADADIDAMLNQSVRREYSAVRNIAVGRGMLPGGRFPIVRAVEKKELYSREAGVDFPAVRVIALSPSDRAIDRAISKLAEGSARIDSRRRLAAGDPNEYSVALWLEIGGVSVLLGADLLVGPEGCGWQAIALWHHPAERASIFKVPHHGSPNAHHQPTWDNLLSSDVVAIVAPFRMGSNPRPNPEDLERIRSNSDRAFSTAQTRNPTPGRAAKSTKVKLQQVARNVRDAHGRPGQVRARWSPTANDWNVEVLPPAYEA